MDEEEFGTTDNYLHAFTAVQAEGVAEHRDRLLRAHLAAPGGATTWAQLAEAVGYPNGSSVHLHYGRFAERVARHLGLTDKPPDPGGTGWWLWVLVRWAEDRDPESGHTVFVLRRPAVEALEQLGWVQPAGFTSPDEVPATGPLVEGAVCRVTVNAYERNPLARRRCIKHHGTACCICGFRFGAEYGPEAGGTSTSTISARCPRWAGRMWSIRSRTCGRCARTATRYCIWASGAGASTRCGSSGRSKGRPPQELLKGEGRL